MEAVAYVYLKVTSTVTLPCDERQSLYNTICEASTYDPPEKVEEGLEECIEAYIDIYMPERRRTL